MFKVVAENINVMSKSIGPAMRNREPKPIQEMAIKLAENKPDYLDINLGPARKAGDEMMAWVVKTVQEVVDIPLWMDTTNVIATEAGLKAYQPKQGAAIINSVSAVAERMDKPMQLAKEFNSGLVALVWGADGMPRDTDERTMNIMMLMEKCEEYGIPHEIIFIDPIVVPVTSQQIELQSCTEFVSGFPDIAPDYLSTCGLSNVSNGAPNHLRPVINQTYLLLLKHVGMKSAIIDGLDKKIIDLARDGRPDLQEVVNRTYDGEVLDMAALTEEQRNFVKTTRILINQGLYSDSWLEI